jgi:hypothetical protein
MKKYLINWNAKIKYQNGKIQIKIQEEKTFTPEDTER